MILIQLDRNNMIILAYLTGAAKYTDCIAEEE